MSDLMLAGGHHLLTFTLAIILAAEGALLRAGLSGSRLVRLGRLDAAYGATAAAILLVGFSRVFFGAKDAGFYLDNPVFWTKIALFAAVGLLSVRPTLRMLSWRRRARNDDAFTPPTGELREVRALILAQVATLMLIPLAAAAMARGYGL